MQSTHSGIRMLSRRVAGAFAPGIAKSALAAFGGLFSDPPQSISAQDPVKGAQRAYEPAIKTRYRQVENKGAKEDESG